MNTRVYTRLSCLLAGVAVGLLLTCPINARAQTLGWVPKAPLPYPQISPSAAAVNGKIYVMAVDAGGNRELEVYDPVSNQWSASPVLSPVDRQSNVVSLNGKLYAVGENSFEQTNFINEFDPVANTWAATVSPPDWYYGRNNFGIGVADARIYVVGGEGGPSGTPPTGYVETFDPVTRTWAIPPALPFPIVQPIVSGLDRVTYVTGGLSAGAFVASPYAIHLSYNGAWNALAAPPHALCCAGASFLSNLLYIVGGTTTATADGNEKPTGTATGILGDVAVYNPSTNQWSNGPSLRQARYYPAVATVNGTLYAIGGRDAAGTPLSSVEALVPVNQLGVTTVGDGTVTSSPAAIGCPPSCAADFQAGTKVTLSAAPANLFRGWSGACSGISACVVTMDAAKTVTATFAPATFALSVAKTGIGKGSITSTPTGIQCGTALVACSSTFANGASITLNAAAAADSKFSGWTGGGCSGAGTCSVVMASAILVSAQFDPLIAIDPLALDFGAQSELTTSPRRVVTITNQSSSSISISFVSASTGFQASTSCTTLSAGAACTIDVTFTPGSEGVANGTLSIQTSLGPEVVSLTGTGERSLVVHYYEAILNRAPDAGGKAFWQGEASRLQALGVNVNEAWYAMAESFFSSPEYLGLKKDDAAFVTDLYATFFNRAPDASGLSYWTSQLSLGQPREIVLVSFMLSSEFVSFTNGIFGATGTRKEIDTLVDFYRGILARLPDDSGFQYWIDRFRKGQCNTLVAGPGPLYSEVDAISSLFANGPEYTSHNRTNAQFVGDLYNAFLRRGGDLAGVQFWIRQLDTGAMSREQLRRSFLASPEFTARVNAMVAEGCVPDTCQNSANDATAGKRFGYAGGGGSTGISSTPGCMWSASSGSPWIHITSTATGIGSGSVSFSVDPNPGSVQRIGGISVGPAYPRSGGGNGPTVADTGHQVAIYQDAAPGAPSPPPSNICASKPPNGAFAYNATWGKWCPIDKPYYYPGQHGSVGHLADSCYAQCPYIGDCDSIVTICY